MGIYTQHPDSASERSQRRAVTGLPGLRKQTIYSASAFLLLTGLVSYNQLTTQSSSSYQSVQKNSIALSSISTGIQAAHQVADQAPASPRDNYDATADSTTSDSTTKASNTASSSMSVVVNGVDIAVPNNGSTTQTVNSESGTGQSKVTVSTTTGQSSDNGSNFSSSYTRTRVRSSASNSSINVNMEQSSP